MWYAQGRSSMNRTPCPFIVLLIMTVGVPLPSAVGLGQFRQRFVDFCHPGAVDDGRIPAERAEAVSHALRAALPAPAVVLAHLEGGGGVVKVHDRDDVAQIVGGGVQDALPVGALFHLAVAQQGPDTGPDAPVGVGMAMPQHQLRPWPREPEETSMPLTRLWLGCAPKGWPMVL